LWGTGLPVIPGYTGRVTPNTGIGVLKYFFYADSSKRPGTELGDKWIAEEAKAYPLKTEDPMWKKEMLIQYGALGGTFLIPKWEQYKVNGHIVIPPYDPVGTRLYGSYDHGFRNPASFLIHSVDGDGIITTVWEFYGDKVPAHQIANIIRNKAGYGDDGRRYAGSPYSYDSLSYIVADPSIWNEDKPQFNGPNKSTAKIFREMGVSMVPGEAGGDVTLGEWLLGYYWKDPNNPIYRITSNCTKLIWEIGQQRFKEFSAQVALNRSQPEELVDKDNHAFDALKYLLKRFPPPEAKRKPEANPNSFMWWRKQHQQQKSGIKRTFRVGAR
jgi:hypothetical protein